jgi:hypothetical protein
MYAVGADGAGKPLVVVSDAGGDKGSWIASDDGLPPQGLVQDLAISKSDPQRAYLALVVPANTLDYILHDGPTGDGDQDRSGVSVVYDTADGGLSWKLRYSSLATGSGPSYPATGPSTIDLLRVDPIDSDTLWASSEGGLFVSSDGGANWRTSLAAGMDSLPGASPEVRAFDVSHDGSGLDVSGLDATSGAIWTTKNGRDWRAQSVSGVRSDYDPGGLYGVSVLYGGSSDQVLAANWKGVYRRVGGLWVDVSPGFQGVWGLSSDYAPTPTFYGISGQDWAEGGIARYKATDSFTGGTGLVETIFHVGEVVDPSALIPPEPKEFGPAQMVSAQDRIRIPLLGSRTVSYRLDLPPRPSALDVFFLTDSTGSMGGAIVGLRRALAGIADGLADSGIDAHVGLGEYRTYRSPSDTRKNVDNFPYRMDRDIGPIDAELSQALGDIDPNGNSGSALTALYQTATGEGQDVIPPGPSDNDIPANEEPIWRAGAQRLVILASDRYFNTPTRPIGPLEYWGDSGPWPGPDFEPVIAAMNRANIHMAGIAVAPTEGDTFGDLRRVAAATATNATTGVDCDGDRDSDVVKGDPIVCGLGRQDGAADALASGVVNMIKAVKDDTDVAIVETSDTGIVQSIGPDAFSGLSLKEFHSLQFEVTFSCGLNDTGKSFDVDLAAVESSRSVAGATTKVLCLDKPDVKLPLPPRPKADPPQLVALPLMPPLPPPPPPTAPGPAPAPNPAPAQASAGQAQGAAVPQRQAQPQMALVHASRQMQEQTAMVQTSARADPLSGPKFGLAVGAISLVLAWGYVTLAMSRVRPAWNRSSRRR